MIENKPKKPEERSFAQIGGYFHLAAVPYAILGVEEVVNNGGFNDLPPSGWALLGLSAALVSAGIYEARKNYHSAIGHLAKAVGMAVGGLGGSAAAWNQYGGHTCPEAYTLAALGAGAYLVGHLIHRREDRKKAGGLEREVLGGKE